MEVKKIVEGMTAPQVAQVIDENFNALNGEKATVEAVADVQKNVNRSDDNTGILSYPVFDDTEPVAVGDVRRYEGLLYRAKEAGAHDWDPEKWERVTLKQLEDEKLSELGSMVGVFIETVNVFGKLMQSGNITNVQDQNYGISEKIFVRDSKKIEIKVKTGWSAGIIQFYNSDNQCILYYNSENSNFKEYHRTYDIPENTDYVIIAAYPGYKSCYKFSDNFDSRISAISSIINQNSDVLLIQATTILGGFLRNGVYVEASGWGVSENIDVVGKKTIRVITSVGYSTDIMAIYNSKDEVLYYDKTQGSDELKKYDRIYKIPKEASYVRIVCSDIATCFYGFNNGKWFDKTWVTIGDSLTEHNLRATHNYHDYISQETGIAVVNNGESGQGYYGDSFKRQIMSINETPDVITIFGSGNDLFKGLQLGAVNDNTTSSLCGYINLTIDYLVEQYPLVPYGIITPCPWEYMEPNENTIHPTLGVENPMRSYCEKMVEICKLRGVPCLDLYHCSNLHPSNAAFRALAYTRDDGNGVHPDEKGHKLIAPRFRAFLESLIES